MSKVGRVDALEMCRTFNCGIGMVLIVDQKFIEKVKQKLMDSGEIVSEIGVVEMKMDGKKLSRFYLTLFSFSDFSDRSSVEIINLERAFPRCSYVVEPKVRVGVLISGTGNYSKRRNLFVK